MYSNNKQTSTNPMDYYDITDRCIDHQSREFDDEIQDVLAPTFSETYGLALSQIEEQPLSLGSGDNLSYHIEESSFPDSKDPALFNGYSESTIPSSQGSPPRLRKADKDSESEESSDKEDSETPFRTPKKIGKGRPRNGHKKGYPTKNFLATFKGPHIQWLEKHLGAEQVARMSVIRQINAKFGISMKDYEKLYTISELRPIWAKMFRSKFLFRALMVSRCLPEVRKVYAPKIPVFEKAFEEQKFYKIN